MRVFVTGITGFLGRTLTPALVESHTVGGLSRDEHKIQDVWKRHADVQMFLGDLAQPERIREAVEAFEPDVVIHAAALKVVPMGEMFAQQFIGTNILGTMNLLSVLPPKIPVVFISTDKAVDAYNVYGATKKAAEILVLNQHSSVVRFGNVFGSTGSVLTTWLYQMRNGLPLTITDLGMTRFFITREQAAGFIIEHLSYPGLWIPKLRAYSMREFLTTFQHVFGIQPTVDIPVRDGEKHHELLVSPNEIHQALDMGNKILLTPYRKGNLLEAYSSKTAPRVGLNVLEQEMRKWK